jgi:hypothetical protein
VADEEGSGGAGDHAGGEAGVLDVYIAAAARNTPTTTTCVFLKRAVGTQASHALSG